MISKIDQSDWMGRSWIDWISTQLRRHLASSSIRWLGIRGGSSKNRWQPNNWWLPYLSVSCAGNNAREFLKSDHRTQHRPKPCSLVAIIQRRWWIYSTMASTHKTFSILVTATAERRSPHRGGMVWRSLPKWVYAAWIANTRLRW